MVRPLSPGGVDQPPGRYIDERKSPCKTFDCWRLGGCSGRLAWALRRNVLNLVYKKVRNAVYGWTIKDWCAAYLDGSRSPQSLLPSLLQQLRDRQDNAWISLATDAQLASQLDALARRRQDAEGDPAVLPLYGVPFALKDNCDAAGWASTAGCPDYLYKASVSAPAIEKLQRAGAILIGKTNLDQFATGLVGTRSPFGIVANAFNPEYIAGGSSSGSAVVVSRGDVPFAIGTDTAGSGRVPAGFNNLVGLKPTRGWISSRGVVPACRTLDCLSVFALDVDDAALVAEQMAGFDSDDPYSRESTTTISGFPAPLRLGIPAGPEWFGDELAQQRYVETCADWQALGAELVELDFSLLHQAAALLYEGPWLAERYVAVGDFVARQGKALDPVVSGIISKGRDFSASDYFRAEYRRAELKRDSDRIWQQVDALLVPTAPIHYRISDVQAEPVLLNSRLGTYTNFVNLLDWCALSLPAGMRTDGLPFGVTLIAPAWSDRALQSLARRWQSHAPWSRGATGQSLLAPQPCSHQCAPDYVRVAVVGAHLSGMPLNYQLLERRALFVERATTSSEYRLFALPDAVPPKPGLICVGDGAEIEVELWDIPITLFGSFVALIPAPLGIGTLRLADGRSVKGFICEDRVRKGARDITAFGGWRAYIASTLPKHNSATTTTAG